MWNPASPRHQNTPTCFSYHMNHIPLSQPHPTLLCLKPNGLSTNSFCMPTFPSNWASKHAAGRLPGMLLLSSTQLTYSHLSDLCSLVTSSDLPFLTTFSEFSTSHTFPSFFPLQVSAQGVNYLFILNVYVEIIWFSLSCKTSAQSAVCVPLTQLSSLTTSYRTTLCY